MYSHCRAERRDDFTSAEPSPLSGEGRNRWRLFPCAVLPIQSVEGSIEELRRAAKLGFKAAAVRPCFWPVGATEIDKTCAAREA